MIHHPVRYRSTAYLRRLRPVPRCYIDPNVLLCFTEFEMARAARLYRKKCPRTISASIDAEVIHCFTDSQRHRAAHRLEVCKMTNLFFELRTRAGFRPPYRPSRNGVARFVQDTYRYGAQSGMACPTTGANLYNLLVSIDRQDLIAKLNSLC